MNKIYATAIGIFLTINSVFATEIPDGMKQTMTHDTGMPSLINLVFSMIVVIGLIYATGLIYNKLNILNKEKLGPLNQDKPAKNRFKILQSMPLGQQRYLYSIEMNNKVMLIGSTQSEITLLREFDSLQIKPGKVDTQKKEYATKIPLQTKTNGINIDEIYQKYKK